MVDVGRLDAFQTHITEEQKSVLASISPFYEGVDGQKRLWKLQLTRLYWN